MTRLTLGTPLTSARQIVHLSVVGIADLLIVSCKGQAIARNRRQA
jgi:hypothetical protein